jgi:hypothetical protein
MFIILDVLPSRKTKGDKMFYALQPLLAQTEQIWLRVLVSLVRQCIFY